MPFFQKVIQAIKDSPMPSSQKTGCLAQAIIESGRGTSKLFQTCTNPFGIKFREEISSVAEPFEIQVPSESSPVKFAKFKSEEDAVKGYELFIKRVPYIGYQDHLSSPEDYINFIGKIYAGDPAYSRKVISVLDEAEFYLSTTNPSPEKIPESVPEKTGVITEKWLRLTKTNIRYASGLFKLKFEVWGLVDGEAKLLVEIPAISGLGNRQVFETAAASPSGSFRPLGEGYYTVGKVEWAGGKDNWNAAWRDNGNGLGPIWQSISCLSKTSRSFLGVHLDWNSASSPGTSGCIGILNTADAKKYLEFAGAMPLTVNWGLGTVETRGTGPRGVSIKPQPQPDPIDPIEPTEPITPEEPKVEPEPENKISGVKVAIDVGHGYYETNDQFDPGATNGKIREWDLNMLQAKIIKEQLEAAGATVNVFSYEAPGSGLTLVQKGKKASGHDIFISLHHNSATPKAQGTEVLIENSEWTNEDRELASIVLQDMSKENGLFVRGVKLQGLGVLSGAHGLCRAKCLTESFFISAEGMTEVLAKDLAEKSAIGIARGIIRYAVENKLS